MEMVKETDIEVVKLDCNKDKLFVDYVINLLLMLFLNFCLEN